VTARGTAVAASCAGRIATELYPRAYAANGIRSGVFPSNSTLGAQLGRVEKSANPSRSELPSADADSVCSNLNHHRPGDYGAVGTALDTGIPSLQWSARLGGSNWNHRSPPTTLESAQMGRPRGREHLAEVSMHITHASHLPWEHKMLREDLWEHLPWEEPTLGTPTQQDAYN